MLDSSDDNNYIVLKMVFSHHEMEYDNNFNLYTEPNSPSNRDWCSLHTVRRLCTVIMQLTLTVSELRKLRYALLVTGHKRYENTRTGLEIPLLTCHIFGIIPNWTQKV